MIVSCAKIYYSSYAFSIAKNHNIIAIVPPAISIQPSKKMDGTALIEQQKAESINFQKKFIHGLKKKEKDKLLKKYKI